MDNIIQLDAALRKVLLDLINDAIFEYSDNTRPDCKHTVLLKQIKHILLTNNEGK